MGSIRVSGSTRRAQGLGFKQKPLSSKFQTRSPEPRSLAHIGDEELQQVSFRFRWVPEHLDLELIILQEPTCKSNDMSLMRRVELGVFAMLQIEQ